MKKSLFLLGFLSFAAHAYHIERIQEENFYNTSVDSNRKLDLPEDVENFLFSEKKGVKTDGLIILKDGEIVYERYARGFGRTTKHAIYSIGKTLSVLMMGIAQEKKLMNLSAPLSTLLPKVDSDKGNITPTNFINMTSGIKFLEQKVLKFGQPNVISLLFGKHVADIGGYMLSLPMRAEPGKVLDYSSGDTNVLWYLLKNQMKEKEYNDFPFTNFFTPLDIQDVTFEQDESGTFLGSTFLYMRPLDLAKIGHLILNSGKFKEKQIVTPEYINFMKSQSPGTPLEKHDPYGHGLWLNTNQANYEGIDEDMLQAHGFDGQSITIFPSKKVVVVRLADDSRLRFDWKAYMKLIGKIL